MLETNLVEMGSTENSAVLHQPTATYMRSNSLLHCSHSLAAKSLVLRKRVNGAHTHVKAYLCTFNLLENDSEILVIACSLLDGASCCMYGSHTPEEGDKLLCSNLLLALLFPRLFFGRALKHNTARRRWFVLT